MNVVVVSRARICRSSLACGCFAQLDAKTYALESSKVPPTHVASVSEERGLLDQQAIVTRATHSPALSLGCMGVRSVNIFGVLRIAGVCDVLKLHL